MIEIIKDNYKTFILICIQTTSGGDIILLKSILTAQFKKSL